MKVNNVSLAAVGVKMSQYPDDGKPEIAFAGKSNVGKSTLINAMIGRKALARTSSQPGKTRTINFYNVEDILYFVDLPGYGYAKVSESEKMRWAKLVEGYLGAGRRIACVFQLIDMRHPPTQDDLHMIQFLLDQELPFALVATKSDKLNQTQRAAQLNLFAEYFQEIPDIPFIPFSAQNGEGVETLRRLIDDACAKS